MVNATLAQGCHYLGRVPANIKFEVDTVLDDGSYLSWIAPDRKSKKKGASRIQVRVFEYTILCDGEQLTYRLITSLMDVALFPALLLATEYHQRWEIENTIDELKTHLNGRKTPIRSLKPREVVQEIYGWLLGHYAVRCLMFQAAQLAGISPLILGFTEVLVVRQRGSHIRLQKRTLDEVLKLTVPAHRPVKRSTLSRIFKQARIDVEQFLELL